MIVQVLAYPLFDNEPEYLGSFSLNSLSVVSYGDGYLDLVTPSAVVAWQEPLGFWHVPFSREAYVKVEVV